MSRQKKLLCLAGILLVVALIANIGTIKDLFSGKSKLRAQITRRFMKPMQIDPVGSEDAKVRLKLYAQSRNDCHAGFIETGKQLGAAVPDRVRVEFVDTGSREGYGEAAKAGIDCEAGIAINDRTQFEIEVNGQEVTVSFRGPLGTETPPREFRLALEAELERQYPDGLSEEEQAALDKLWEEVPDLLAKGGEGGVGPGGMGPGMMPDPMGGGLIGTKGQAPHGPEPPAGEEGQTSSTPPTEEEETSSSVDETTEEPGE